MSHLLLRAQAPWSRGGTEGPCSCSAPFDRIAEINFNIEADEDSGRDGLLQGGRAEQHLITLLRYSGSAHTLARVTDGTMGPWPLYLCVRTGRLLSMGVGSRASLLASSHTVCQPWSLS